MESRKSITPAFNFLLLLVLVATAILQGLGEPANVEMTRMDLLFGEQHFWTMMTFSFIAIVIMIFLISFALKEFWNRLVVDLFRLREIQFSESLSLMLMVSILLGVM